jgi:hypothetical protein
MMKRHAAGHLLATLACGALLAPVALAEPPADKGKAPAAAQAPVKGMPNDRAHQDERGKADDNHGQVVSECNHRANQKNLKGKDRQDYVEWCTDRGERYRYDDRRYDRDRGCYRRAEERGLSGDFRRVFIQDCLRKVDKDR